MAFRSHYWGAHRRGRLVRAAVVVALFMYALFVLALAGMYQWRDEAMMPEWQLPLLALPALLLVVVFYLFPPPPRTAAVLPPSPLPVASVPELPGCVWAGASMQEARERLTEAIEKLRSAPRDGSVPASVLQRLGVVVPKSRRHAWGVHPVGKAIRTAVLVVACVLFLVAPLLTAAGNELWDLWVTLGAFFMVVTVLLVLPPPKKVEGRAIAIEADDDGGFIARVPDLPGCGSSGRTLEEVRQNVAVAIEAHLAQQRSAAAGAETRERTAHP